MKSTLSIGIAWFLTLHSSSVKGLRPFLQAKMLPSHGHLADPGQLPDAVTAGGIRGRVPFSRRSQLTHERVHHMKPCYANSENATPSLCPVNERLLFLHIPKNAGTTIESRAAQHGVRWGRYMNFDSCNIGTGRCWARWHEPPALMIPTSIYGNATVFCVIRDPFERAISEYKYIYENEEFQWENSDLINRYGCSPDGLNEWLVRVLTRYEDGDTYEQLCHMLPQSYYIWGPPDNSRNQCQYCHEILRMEEDLPASFNELMQIYNYPVRMDSEQHNAGGCPNLNAQSLNSTAVELILRIYERDFAMLDYSTNASQGR
mmetsp:Transcript_48778/g.141299  ORF Transcript_48778/g.141299 Transcript_48778/m.141299 type:complete len:317 (-) Transcript_48778:161-1111(-)